MGSARLACVFQFGRRDFDLGGVYGMLTLTARICLIFTVSPYVAISLIGGQYNRLECKYITCGITDLGCGVV